MDITCIPMKTGFMHLTAIIDLYSRYVINRSLSNRMRDGWCDEVLKQAIKNHGAFEICMSGIK